MANWYSLNGSLLRIDAADADLEKPLFAYFDELRTNPHDGPAEFTFILERGVPRSEPPGASLLYENTRLEPPLCRLSAYGDRRLFVVPEQISLEYSIPERFALFRAAPGREYRIGRLAAIHAIYAALAATGQALIHAAALKLPSQSSAFVLFARSGAGKTTTSLALALQGFSLMSDDATVLASPHPGERAHVWGLPRPPKVHRRTGEMLPKIGRLLGPRWSEDGEQSLPKEKLSSVVELIPGQAFPLAALVLLGSRVVGRHTLRPLSKADLLVHFAADNVVNTPNGLLPEDLVRYQRLVSLIACTPGYELNVGSDLSTLGETIAAELDASDQAILSA